MYDNLLPLFPILLIFAAAWYFLLRKPKTKKPVKEDHATRQGRAVWARAVVLSSEVGAQGMTGLSRVSIKFEVHLPGADPYMGQAVWLVEQSALEYVQAGKDVSVKIDRENPQYIYPHGSWATYAQNL
jgi:hypothetical protein